jgi:hypothetical protein
MNGSMRDGRENGSRWEYSACFISAAINFLLTITRSWKHSAANDKRAFRYREQA